MDKTRKAQMKSLISQEPPIQEVQVLELRQQSARSTTYAPADYRTDLDKDILIEENDIVKIKSVFVDSVTTTDDKIHVRPDVLPEDPNFADATDLERNFMRIDTNHNVYYRNWGFTFFDPSTQRDYKKTGDAGLPAVDGKDYIATITKTKAGEDIVDVTGIVFGFSNYFGKAPDPCHINLQYETIAGNKQYIRLQVPQKVIKKQRDRSGSSTFILDKDTKLASGSHSITFPITCVNGSLVLSTNNDKHQDTNKKQLHEGGLTYPTFIGNQQTTNTANDFFVPMDFPQTFYLRSGDYEKKELSRQLSFLFAGLSNGSGVDQGQLTRHSYDLRFSGNTYPNDLTGNSFLVSADAIRRTRGNAVPRSGTSVGTDADTNGRPTFVRVDSKNAFQFKTLNTSVAGSEKLDYWIGSDQGIQIDYNELVNKFEIVQTHMSIRDKNANAITSSTLVNDQGTEVLQMNNKLSGIYLKNLQPEEFWFGDKGLGFSRSILVDDSKMVTLQDGTDFPTFDDGTNISVPNLETGLIDGTSTTGDLLITDNLTFKGNQAPTFDPDNGKTFANGGLAFDVAVLPSAFNIAVQQTNSIYSDLDNRPDTSSHEAKSYFKIEVDMGLNNDLVNAQNPKIKSIMNRYYAVDSYTTSYGEGDITYEHKGSPVKVSSVGIRILRPDGTLSDDIGNANSVFLEIIKQK